MENNPAMSETTNQIVTQLITINHYLSMDYTIFGGNKNRSIDPPKYGDQLLVSEIRGHGGHFQLSNLLKQLSKIVNWYNIITNM